MLSPFDFNIHFKFSLVTIKFSLVKTKENGNFIFFLVRFSLPRNHIIHIQFIRFALVSKSIFRNKRFLFFSLSLDIIVIAFRCPVVYGNFSKRLTFAHMLNGISFGFRFGWFGQNLCIKFTQFGQLTCVLAMGPD